MPYFSYSPIPIPFSNLRRNPEPNSSGTNGISSSPASSRSEEMWHSSRRIFGTSNRINCSGEHHGQRPCDTTVPFGNSTSTHVPAASRILPQTQHFVIILNFPSHSHLKIGASVLKCTVSVTKQTSNNYGRSNRT